MIISYKNILHHCAWCLALCAMLCSCTQSDTFRLTGDFSHLRQGDFFVYSTDGGIDHADTIHVVDGQFKWQTPLTQEATFFVIFPNLSEQVIFAQPGDNIKMKGDAEQLRATQVKGSKENDLLTRFRMEHLQDTEAELSEAMKLFIKENPKSRVSTYFKRQLMIRRVTYSNIKKGQRLPSIILPPDQPDSQDTLHVDSLHSVLLVFWSSWKRTSRDVLPQVRKLLRQLEAQPQPKKHSLQAISISLDTDKYQYQISCKYDSVTWPSRCYFQSWDTPVVKQLKLCDIPYFVLTDEKQTVTALGTDWKKDIEPVLKKQFHLK